MKSHRIASHGWVKLALALSFFAPAAWAQAWPNKPIRFVVAFAPGGPADIIARLLGQKLGEALGQSILVENRGGAGGSIASAAIAKAEPDGYTLLINTSAYAVNPAMQRNIPFDSEKDLTLSVLVASSPNIIVATPNLPAQNLKELLVAAQSGKYNYGTAGAGTTPHLTAEYLFKVLSKVSITHIPFQGGGPALNAAMAGQVELTSVALPPAVELVKAGKVRGIVVTGSKRAAALPLVPTVAESGFPGFEDTTWVGVFAPSRTPPEIIARINLEVNTILKNPEFQSKLASIGFEPMGGTSAEAAEFLKTELSKWARVVRETGAKAD
jgi:tripartite-type tricarboxylate transporter receptor subunit TctC